MTIHVAAKLTFVHPTKDMLIFFTSTSNSSYFLEMKFSTQKKLPQLNLHYILTETGFLLEQYTNQQNFNLKYKSIHRLKEHYETHQRNTSEELQLRSQVDSSVLHHRNGLLVALRDHL